VTNIIATVIPTQVPVMLRVKGRVRTVEGVEGHPRTTVGRAKGRSMIALSTPRPRNRSRIEDVRRCGTRSGVKQGRESEQATVNLSASSGFGTRRGAPKGTQAVAESVVEQGRHRNQHEQAQ